MENIYSRELTILPSMADSSARLGVTKTFALFMDIASEHAETLGSGLAAMNRRGLFWLTVKTRIRFYRRPGLMEKVTVSTWPETPSGFRCNRDYTIKKGEELLAAGKTEWAILEVKTGKMFSPAEIYPPELLLLEPPVWEDRFTRMDLDFTGAEELGRYTVASADIDLGGHMNNAAYVGMLERLYSTKDWNALPMRELEVIFRSSCYEGENLTVLRREAGEAAEYCALKEDGKPALLARML